MYCIQPPINKVMTMGHCHITTLPCITPPKPYFRLTGGARAKVKRRAVDALKNILVIDTNRS